MWKLTGQTGGQRSWWVDLEEEFQPRDLPIVGWEPCRLPVTVAPVCGAWPALPSVDAPSAQCALCASWLKPDSLHPEGWALAQEDRGLKTRLKLLTYGFFLGQVPSSLGIVEGLYKSPEVAQKFDSLVGAADMGMQRWSLRWKTKRWIMDSTLTTFITLFLLLQAASVRAGKIGMIDEQLFWKKKKKVWENSGRWRD